MQKFVFSFLLIVIFFSSCRSYRHVYSPAPANNPFFANKGDSKLTILYSGGDGNTGNGMRDKNEGIDIQAAYALGKEFAITSSYFFRKERDLYPEDYYDTSTVSYKRRLTDAGIGWFKALDRRKKITFNLYAGLGFGKFSINDKGLDNNFAPYSRYHTADISKWYLQQSFNFIPSSTFSIGFVGRFSFIRFSDINTNYDSDELQYFYLDRVNKRTFSVFEPSMNLQFGFKEVKWLRAEAALGFAANWSTNFPSTRTVNASVGISLNLASLKKENKKSTDQK
jgi:hypothetical protein